MLELSWELNGMESQRTYDSILDACDSAETSD
jgi:hypothetical protein